MSNTATQAQPSQTAEGSDQASPAKTRIPGKVITFDPANISKLKQFKPVEISRGGAGRQSPLQPVLDSIRDNPEAHGQPVPLMEYENLNSAKAQLQNLKARLGPVEASGFTFQVFVDKQGKGTYIVVGTYDGGKVTDEGVKAHVKVVAERRKKEAEKQAAKVAASSNAN